jgi:hypothetical protein
MNKKLLNTQIEAINIQHGSEIVQFYFENGFNTNAYKGVHTKSNNDSSRFYGVNSLGNFTNRLEQPYENMKTITLEEAKALVKNEYPKVMLVRQNTRDNFIKRVVFMEKNGFFLAWASAETLKDAEKVCAVTPWKYAEDIKPEPVIKELTLQEIADKFDISIDQLRIKDKS